MAALCDTCRQIFIQKKNASGPLAHHRDFQDLVRSSEHGCSLCSLVWSRLESYEQDQLTTAQTTWSVLEPPRITCVLSSDGSWSSGWNLESHYAVTCTFDFVTPESEHIRKEILFMSLEGDITLGTYYVKWHLKRSGALSKPLEQGDTCDPRSISVVDVISAAKRRVRDSTAILPKFFRQNTNTGSEESLERAAEWVTTCVKAHSGCKRKTALTESRLPTRLVWVSPAEDRPLLLRETSELPLDTKYLTLSHCWGKKAFLVLTSQNINKFRASIQFTDLTKTFQDAITVTRFMQIEYIWIDSLCIIQDSPEDWEKESSLMRYIYANSFCNIAAAHAYDGDAGCFTDRTLPAPPIRVSIPSSFGWDNHFRPGTYESRAPELWTDEVTQSPLQKRGWVFQECILAPRILYFAKNQIFFSCQLRLCELYPDTLGLFQQPFQQEKDGFRIRFWDVISRALKDKSPSGRLLSAIALWISMVQIYTERDLSRESDRLVAISGLARFLQPMTGCRYLAGLWEDHLILQLLWKSCGKSFRTESYQAPSWSWASRTGPIFIQTNTDVDAAVGIQPPSKHWSLSDEELAFVVDAETATANGDPMSPVTSGCLRLKGILIPIALEDGENEFKIRGHNCDVSVDISSEKLAGRFFFVVCVSTELWFDFQLFGARGLLLRPTGKIKGQYQRVGHVDVSMSRTCFQDEFLSEARSLDNRKIMTEDLYERYDDESELYTFTIV